MILENKVAIVTGAGSGIGRGSAMILAQEGARVVVSDINLDNAQQTVAQITASGGQGIAIKTDVGDDDQLGLLIDTTLKIYKRLDIVHSHVGIQIEGTLEQVDPKGMDASWKLNVYAHFMLTRLAVPHMKKQGGGSIVLTASNSGVQYDREMIAYATSKHAAVAMTKQMAADYARYNIRVNTLCPGWVDTPFNDPFMKQMGGREALEAYISEQIPMGRWATVDEISQAALFLASERSSFMTGQALVIDGGESL